MKATDRLVRAYLALLGLFPGGYRRKYAQELEWVVRQAAEAEDEQGHLALLRFAGRELRDLPGALLLAHLDQRRRNQMEANSRINPSERPESGWRLILLLTPYLMTAFVLLVTSIPVTHLPDLLIWIVLIGLLALLAGVILAGLIKGLPRWALPSLGFLLGLAGLFIFNAWIDRLWLYPWPRTIPERVMWQVIMKLLFYGPTLLLSLVLLLAAAGLPFLRPFFRQVRADWTRLSFLLLGVPLFAVLIGNDEYHPLQLYQFAGLACLAAGSWAYLRLGRAWQRLLALLAGTGLAMGALSLGIYQLYPLQPWAVSTPFPRWWETIQPLCDAAALFIMLSLPALLGLLPDHPDWEEAEPT
jgi:hypothetical protein